ncbi:MAG: hypothetical protein ACR2KL_07005 [Nocardioidaceae bacterium]
MRVQFAAKAFLDPRDPRRAAPPADAVAAQSSADFDHGRVLLAVADLELLTGRASGNWSPVVVRVIARSPFVPDRRRGSWRSRAVFVVDLRCCRRRAWPFARAARAGRDSADVTVVFGITGDLARKMTFRALYRLERRGLLSCPIIGVGHDEMSTEELVQRARQAIGDAGENVDEKVLDRLAGRLSYLHGDVLDDAVYGLLGGKVRQHHRPLFYPEMPRRCSGPSSSTSPRSACWSTPGSPRRSRSGTTSPRHAS